MRNKIILAPKHGARPGEDFPHTSSSKATSSLQLLLSSCCAVGGRAWGAQVTSLAPTAWQWVGEPGLSPVCLTGAQAPHWEAGMCPLYPRCPMPGAGSEQRNLGNVCWAERNQIGLLEEIARSRFLLDTEPWRAFLQPSSEHRVWHIGMFRQGLWINKGVNT